MSQSAVANLNMPSVSVQQFGLIIKDEIDGGDYSPILGIGKAGVGKTSITNSVAKELGIGYVELRLGHIPQQDLIGMPDITVDERTGRKYTEYVQQGILPPSVWDDNYNNGKGGWRGLSKEEGGKGEVGILALDEITSCSQDVRVAAYQLLDSQRAIHEYHLPDKWKCIALGNGPDDGGSYIGAETALITRCMSFRIDSDAESWKTFAIKNNLNSSIVAFIELFPDKMHTMDINSEYEEACAVPRSWENLSRHLDRDEANGFGTDNFIVTAHVTGCIGDSVGQEFLALYHKNKDTVDPRDILSGKADPKDGAMFRATEQNKDARAIGVLTISKAVGELVKDMEDSKKGKDINIVKEAANFVSWIIKIHDFGSPLDISIAGLRNLIEASSDFSSILTSNTEFDELCPDFVDFAVKNQIIGA